VSARVVFGRQVTPKGIGSILLSRLGEGTRRRFEKIRHPLDRSRNAPIVREAEFLSRESAAGFFSERARLSVRAERSEDQEAATRCTDAHTHVTVLTGAELFFLLQSRRRKRLNRVRMARYRRAGPARPPISVQRRRSRITGISKSRTGRTPSTPGW